MGDGLALWWRYARASVRSQMQYRASFLLSAFGQFLGTGIEFVALWALFDRFGSLRGWTLAEVGLFYGVAHVSLALANGLATGFSEAGELIRTGALDRLLLRPRSTALQLLGYQFSLRRLGRLLQGTLVLVWAVGAVDASLGALELLLLGATLVCATCMFLGLFVLQATMSIWTVQTLELVNATTYGGAYAGQHPMSIYERWFRWAFTFVVPLTCVSYFPIVTVLDRIDPLATPRWLGVVTPLAGPLFLALSLVAWSWGLRRYTSTGS